jgi:carboxymethylenebutenolidase
MEHQELTQAQQALIDNLKAHAEAELVDRDVEATLETMATNPYIFLAPSLTGGDGPEGVRRFYTGVLGHMPKDFARTPVTRTVGTDRVVIEEILSFTHDVVMDWMVPGVPPTGKRVELPLVVVCTFKDGKLESERAYWDQASMLMQLGVLDASGLPVTGAETVRKLLQLTGPR